MFRREVAQADRGGVRSQLVVQVEVFGTIRCTLNRLSAAAAPHIEGGHPFVPDRLAQLAQRLQGRPTSGLPLVVPVPTDDGCTESYVDGADRCGRFASASSAASSSGAATPAARLATLAR
jgi:hypothetical protein